MNHKMLLAAAGLIVFATACHKNDDDGPVGGKGGNAVLHVTAKHHARTIDSMKIYIKYNASDLPTTFDDSAVVVRTSTDTAAVFTGLKTGRYYLYGKGWDQAIRDTVLGGTPYTITAENDIKLVVPVTEGD